MSIKIFCCYAHEDEVLLDKLKGQLRPFQRKGIIDVWYDRDIGAGSEWELEIKEHLDTAQIILLLISPDFMNSDYCYSVELKRALERHKSGEARVLPIILRPVHWQAVLGNLQALPKDGKPVVGLDWYSVDNALFNVAEGIVKAVKTVEDMQKKATPKNPLPQNVPTPQTTLQNAPQSVASQQFIPSYPAPPPIIEHSVHTSPQVNVNQQANVMKQWRRPLIVLGTISGLALTAFGVAGFLVSFYDATIPHFSVSNIITGYILATILIGSGAVIFCKSAVAMIGRYIGIFSIILAAILFIYGFFLSDHNNFVGGVLIILLGGIFFWTTRARKW